MFPFLCLIFAFRNIPVVVLNLGYGRVLPSYSFFFNGVVENFFEKKVGKSGAWWRKYLSLPIK